MIDLRDYKGVIREAIRFERNHDENWAWRIRAINKSSAKFGWGYTDFLGEKKDFVLTAEEDENIGIIVRCVEPHGHSVILFVGEDRWADYHTLEEAIAGAIHSIVLYCHNRY